MDLFGWLFERNNPGPTGSFEKHYNGRLRNPFSIIAGGMVSILVLIAPFYSILYYRGFDLKIMGLTAAGLLIYLLIAYRVNPVAETENMGYLGGLINNPFRYTDDINRFFLFMKILLYPGRLLGIGLVDLWDLLRKGVRP